MPSVGSGKYSPGPDMAKLSLTSYYWPGIYGIGPVLSGRFSTNDAKDSFGNNPIEAVLVSECVRNEMYFCRHCGGDRLIRPGRSASGKQPYLCHAFPPTGGDRGGGRLKNIHVDTFVVRRSKRGCLYSKN